MTQDAEKYVRDSFERFYAPRPDEHEPAEGWAWRAVWFVIWVPAIVLALRWLTA